MIAAVELKKRHELLVFQQFASAGGLKGDLSLAEVREPPEPDIYFAGDDQACYFELGRLADSEYARFILEVHRRAPQPVAPNFAKIGYPQRDVLLQKIQKSYQTSGVPVQLVLYFDADSPHTEGPMPPMQFGDEAAIVVEPILRNSMGPFARVWFFERYRHSVLWCYP